MGQRFVTIWFPYLLVDWFTRRQPLLQQRPFVIAAPDHGRLLVTAANRIAQQQGVRTGMTVADARAVLPSLEVLDDDPVLAGRLLKLLGYWCIRFTPVTALDSPDGLILDVSGCTHLWGGEQPYLTDMCTRLEARGYVVRAAMADTIGAARAVTRFGHAGILAPGEQATALAQLPPAALHPDPLVLERLHQLGLYRIGDFAGMERQALRRRFGTALLLRLDQALGLETTPIEPLQPVNPYEERLPCLEPIVTATGIAIALQRLLEQLCQRLQQEGKGLRKAILKSYRVDGRVEQIEIGTNHASYHVQHLFRLFEVKIDRIEPALGIELFILEAPQVEPVTARQESLWNNSGALDHVQVAELLDRLAGRGGPDCVRRYLPAEHYWPERAVQKATSLQEQPAGNWPLHLQRPVHLLPRPQAIEVTAPIPDYPPMLFRYKGTLHTVKKADGPERIEQEWWLTEGAHRDYYVVEDEQGGRYWLFRLGHYDATRSPEWFIHGFFA